MDFEWDRRKATTNLRKHGVDFADAATVLHDERALTRGTNSGGRLYLARSDSAADCRSQGYPSRARSIRGWAMKPEYDFSKGKRGAPAAAGRGKTRITIRIDQDILAWFRGAAHDQGGGSYQTLINSALRDHMEARQGNLEQTLRRVIREELPRGLREAAGQ